MCNIMTMNYLIIETSGKCNHNRDLESNDGQAGARVSLTSNLKKMEIQTIPCDLKQDLNIQTSVRRRGTIER